MEGSVVDRAGKPLKNVEVQVEPIALADGSPVPLEANPLARFSASALMGETDVERLVTALKLGYGFKNGSEQGPRVSAGARGVRVVLEPLR